MNIEELEELRKEAFFNDRELPWVNPRDVVGVDMEDAKRINWTRHHSQTPVEEYGDDDKIVEYMTTYFKQNENGISALELVDSLIYLVENFWSTPAAVFLSNETHLVNAGIVNQCVLTLRKAFANSEDWIVKALLREFVVHYFNPELVYMRTILSSTLSGENLEFIQELRGNRKFDFSCPPFHIKNKYSHVWP